MKKRLINFLLKHLFNAVTEDDILVYSKHSRTFYINGREIGEMQTKSLKEEAKVIKELQVWDLLSKDLKMVANRKMYENSTCVDDIIFGKAMLYSIDLIDRKINNLINSK